MVTCYLLPKCFWESQKLTCFYILNKELIMSNSQGLSET